MSQIIYEIIVFDDGNQKLKDLHNRWTLIGTTHGGGKYILKHVKTNITINTISAWKVRRMDSFPE
jgi:hypothetical protein